MEERVSWFMPYQSEQLPYLDMRFWTTACRSKGERPASIAPDGGSWDYELKEEPQPQVDFAFGFLIAKPPPIKSSL